MPIDIDTLTENDLRDLHHRITQRLRMIHQLRAHSTMLEFSIGDRVAFNADGRRITGVLTRYNRKTVTIIADGGHNWNVSPGLLVRAEHRAGQNGDQPTVVVTPVARPPSTGNMLPRAGYDAGGRS